MRWRRRWGAGQLSVVWTCPGLDAGDLTRAEWPVSSTAWEGTWRKATNRWWLRPAVVPDGLPPCIHSLENPSKRGSRVQIGKALKGEGLKKNKKQRLLRPLPKYCQMCWGREQRASLLLIDFPTARVLGVRRLSCVLQNLCFVVVLQMLSCV